MNQLTRGDDVVRLEPKSMDVLTTLAEHPGAVVSRDQLLADVWPGLVVSDDALTQAVIKLRKALGDTARDAEYIETVAKRGYRLIAPVTRERIDARAADEIAHRAGRNWRQILAAAALVVVVLGAVSLIVAQRLEDPGEAANPALLQRGLALFASQPVIAVRPFEVIGEDVGQAALAAGLTSDLITDLAQVPGLTVLGGSRPVLEASPASSALAEQYVVSGSVQRHADRLRVNVQLIDAAAGRQVWSERYERSAADLFVVQDAVLKRLLDVLPVKINEAERVRSAGHYTRSLEAYELFHRGLLAMGAREQQQNAEARALYTRAIALDPGFARAYAGVAMTHAQDYRQQWAADGQGALAKAIETAEVARKMDPTSAESLWVLAFARAHERRHGEAMGLLHEALRLNPSYADAYFLMGLLLMELGRPNEGLSWMQAAMRVVPNPGYIHHFGLGQAYYFAGEHERAVVHLQAAVARNPAHVEAHLYAAAALAELERSDEASWHLVEARNLRPALRTKAWLERHPVVHREQRARLAAALHRLGLPD